MRPEYFINEMLRKIDYALISTYLVEKKKRKKKWLNLVRRHILTKW